MARRKSETPEVRRPADVEQQEEPGTLAVVPCNSNPCYAPAATTFTTSIATRTVTATPAFSGNVTWNWGDGSSTSNKRGVQGHTYAAAGTYQVVATPLSSCVGASAQVPVTVA